MLTPNELEAIPEPLVKLFRQLELDVMRDIIGRLSVNRDISRTADWEISRLYELGVSKRAIKKRIKDALKLSTREINLIYKNVIWQDYARYEPIYRTKGKPWIPYEKNRQLQQLVSGIKEQTLGEFKNITQSLGFAVKRPDGTRVFQPIAEYYQKTLDNAAMGMLSGVYDYNTMIKKAVRELTESGLRTVDYITETDEGKTKTHTNRVEVAARRALMTGFNQVVAKITEENAEQLGTDKFEVTYHRGARPTHQPWQGRVYTREQLVTVCGYGDVTGLKGANCYHDFHPFFEGLSKRLYTDEELDRMNAEENTPKQYGGKEYTAYEALQRQRRMETSLRRKREEIELLEKGGANEDDILAAKAKYHALSNEYAEFSKAMNLPQQRERISADGRKGVDVSFGKSVANSEKSGIMKAEGVNGLEQAKKRDKKIFVTDVAIDKVTKSKVKLLSSEHNSKIDAIHKELLTVSKNENHSDEVAILFELNSAKKFSQMGTEHVVNIFDNPMAYSLAKNSEANSLFLAHNHPSTQSFSYADIGVLMYVDSLAGMSVVSNTGDVHILFKSSKFNYKGAYDALTAIKKSFGGYKPEHDLDIVKAFLKVAPKYGLLQY